MYMFTPQATFTVMSFKIRSCHMEVPQCNDVAKNPTWLEIRSSHTDSAIWIALALWVTEIAVNLNLSLPYTWFACVTASLNTCSYLFWLRTAPMFTILGSQPPRTQEQENNAASSSRRIVWRARRAHGEPQYPPLLSLPEARVGAIRLRRLKAMSSVAIFRIPVAKCTHTAAMCSWCPVHLGDGIWETGIHCSLFLNSLLKSGCRQAEQESHILHEAWQQNSVMRIVSSFSSLCASAAVVLQRSCPWCWQLCAHFYARPRTSRWRCTQIKTLRCHKQPMPCVKWKKRENCSSIWSKCELCFHNSINGF